MSASPKYTERRNLLAATVGNVLEWYDFAIYGFLAAIIGKHFFPADDPLASLLEILWLWREHVDFFQG